MPRLASSALAAVLACLVFAASAFAQPPGKDAPKDAAPPPITADDAKKAADEAKKSGDDAGKAATVAKQTGNMSWMLVSTALVMLMVPGLALFYAGMVRRKNVLGTMMHSMVALGLVGVQWVLFGYALSFGETKGGYIGWSPELAGLSVDAAVGVPTPPDDASDDAKKEAEKKNRFKTFPNTDLPLYLHVMFQGMFAIITAGLISGAFAERVKFSTYLVFILIWTTIVYDPLAHWVWSFNWVKDDKGALTAAGWLGAKGALDFAGGTVVHIAAGFSGLAAVLLLKKRIGYKKTTFHPNSMVLTLLGAGLLWFGWFGFNGGSAGACTAQAVSAFTVTQIAAATAGLAWLIVEWIHKGKPTALGFASGVVAGLVAITPASGFVAPNGALWIGAIAGALCYGAVLLKGVLGYDDSLDAFGVHGVGGFIGAVLTGVFVSIPLWMYGTGAEEKAFPGKVGEDGKWNPSAQLSVQFTAALVSAAYAFVVTAVLVLILDKTMGFSLKPEDEHDGLDVAVHGEVGFDYGGAALEEGGASFTGEPRAASAPPNGAAAPKRFTIVAEGASPEALMSAWSELCKPNENEPPSEAFLAVYPFVTTVSGNKFRFRGGDPVILREALNRVLVEALDGAPVKTYVES